MSASAGAIGVRGAFPLMQSAHEHGVGAVSPLSPRELPSGRTDNSLAGGIPVSRAWELLRTYTEQVHQPVAGAV